MFQPSCVANIRKFSEEKCMYVCMYIYINVYIFLKMRFKLHSYDHHVNSFGKLYVPVYCVNLLCCSVLTCLLHLYLVKFHLAMC